MSTLAFRSVLFACVLGAASQSSDPFVGTWKFDSSRSTIVDEIRIEAAGVNRYAFTPVPNQPGDTIVADGMDHPGVGGTTLSIAIDERGQWTVVRKQDGRTLLSAQWTLSPDGQTLHDAFTYYPPDGASSTTNYVYRRTAGQSGMLGTWESTTPPNVTFELDIQPYETDGLSILNSQTQSTTRVKFDGQDYPNVGPNGPTGSVTSARRVDQHTLELTSKVGAQVRYTQHATVSSDLRTLTMTVHPTGRAKPNVLVFGRE